MDDFKLIEIVPGNPVVLQKNPTNYPLIGKGLQGAVFKLSEDRCVKIYSRKRYCKRDSQVLREIGQQSSIVPEIYEIGDKYIIMEYLSGPSLQEIFEEQREISEPICIQMIELLHEQIRCQFPRIDFALRHAIYDGKGRLKLIDHVNSFRVKRTVPTRLLKDLKQIGLLEEFLEKVKPIEPQFYEQWKKLRIRNS
ncbi:hypothetical protein [Bacillus sp. JJ1764]|uniref:hypothetical protein n=1 Tax=Bacillus sp. JJ1764 TaxID=3122964 RepID=UPI002FFE7439